MKELGSIMRAVDESLFAGAKVAHGLSHPVLRCQNGEYKLAVFAYYVTRDNARNGTLSRPSKWAVVDLKTEEIVEVNSCKEKDFTVADWNSSYNMMVYSKGEPTKEQIKNAYILLDEFRAEYSNSSAKADCLAEAYLKELFGLIPDEYVRFYKDISIAQ